MNDKIPVTFAENKPIIEKNSLNHCKLCGKRAGRFMDKQTYAQFGIFLYADARGFKVCNLCKDNGDFIGKRKMTKKERKQLTKLKHAMREMPKLKHVTLDVKGNTV